VQLSSKLKNPDERSFYEIEAATNHWRVRELERQITSALFERLALSNDKDTVKRLASQGQIIE
jgi:predicted nuclease of restriction endonuclease-like (RecB) superfamily